MKRFITLFLMFVTCCLYANVITGYGNADNPDSAKALALQDLSSKISVEVQSMVKDFVEEGSVGNTSGTIEYSSSTVNVNADLTILGAQYTESNKGKVYTCKASIDTETSAPLYISTLQNLANEINNNTKKISTKKMSNDSKIDLLSTNLTKIQEFNKLKKVANYLGCKNIPILESDESDILNIIKNLQKKVDSIDLAAKVLTKKLTKLKHKIYVYPMTQSGLHEITPFARTFKDNIEKYIPYTDNLSKASYLFHGKYSLINDGKDGIQVIYCLTDKEKNNILTLTVDLLPQAYQGLQFETKTTSFDKMLHEGIVVSNDFKIDITTNRGKEDLLFNSTETVKILVKLNRAGYYYIVGHIVKDDENFSYLLETSDGQGNRKFINYINQDDANKWLELGEFTIEPPYGVESLQVIACTADFDTVPATTFDKNSGYYVISGTATEAVKATRGLKPKKTEEILSAEDVLFFTTAK